MPDETGSNPNEVGPGRPPAKGQFRKGQSGNPRGRPKTKTLTELVREVLERDHNGRLTLQVLAEVVVREAAKGKFPFVKEVWDRLEGQPPARHHIAGEDGGPIIFEIIENSPPNEPPSEPRAGAEPP